MAVLADAVHRLKQSSRNLAVAWPAPPPAADQPKRQQPVCRLTVTLRSLHTPTPSSGRSTSRSVGRPPDRLAHAIATSSSVSTTALHPEACSLSQRPSRPAMSRSKGHEQFEPQPYADGTGAFVAPEASRPRPASETIAGVHDGNRRQPYEIHPSAVGDENAKGSFPVPSANSSTGAVTLTLSDQQQGRVPADLPLVSQSQEWLTEEADEGAVLESIGTLTLNSKEDVGAGERQLISEAEVVPALANSTAESAKPKGRTRGRPPKNMNKKNVGRPRKPSSRDDVARGPRLSETVKFPARGVKKRGRPPKKDVTSGKPPGVRPLRQTSDRRQKVVEKVCSIRETAKYPSQSTGRQTANVLDPRSKFNPGYFSHRQEKSVTPAPNEHAAARPTDTERMVVQLTAKQIATPTPDEHAAAHPTDTENKDVTSRKPPGVRPLGQTSDRSQMVVEEVCSIRDTAKDPTQFTGRQTVNVLDPRSKFNPGYFSHRQEQSVTPAPNERADAHPTDAERMVVQLTAKQIATPTPDEHAAAHPTDTESEAAQLASEASSEIHASSGSTLYPNLLDVTTW